MGKGIIISGGTKGLYSIQLAYDRRRVAAAIARIDARIADITAWVAAHVSPPISAAEAARCKMEIAALRLRKKILGNCPGDVFMSAWCADFTEDLAPEAEVGTIEIPGERAGGVNIQPGFNNNAVYNDARDGTLQHALAGTPESLFWNLGMLPGWQKWKPTYRYGTITSLQIAENIEDGDFCDIALDAAVSSVRDKNSNNLNVNQDSTLANVPISYMCCHGAAFEAGDEVLVAFTGQDWAQPCVIGYKSNPRPCHDRVVVRISLTGIPGETLDKSAAFVWDPKYSTPERAPCVSTDAALLAWLAARTAVGHDLFTGKAECGTRIAGTAEPGAIVYPVGSTPAGCSALTEGMQDIKYDNGYAYLYCTWQGADYYGLIINNGFEYPAARSGDYFYDTIFLYPQSYYQGVNLPGSIIEAAGFRVHRNVVKTGDQGYVGTDPPLDHAVVSTVWQDRFFGPLGEIGGFDGQRNSTAPWLSYWGNAEHGVYFIPHWKAGKMFVGRTYNIGDEILYADASGLPRLYDTRYCTAQDLYMSNHIWFDSALAGRYSYQVIADVCLVQFTPCTGTAGINYDSGASALSMVPDETRTILVQAQALYRRVGLAGYDWAAAGSNAALEAQIIAAINMAYELNGIPDNEIRECTVGVEIVR